LKAYQVLAKNFLDCLLLQESNMKREEALEKIAWHSLKKINKDDAYEILEQFFKEPLKPSLRELLNITVVVQYETHEPPEDLNPGNSIYRPILVDRMKRPFRGATNEYLINYLNNLLGIKVDKIEGEPPTWLNCPVCVYRTFETLGAWDNCPVCGWNSDPMQEAMPDEPIGANGISLTEARQNFQEFGAITKAKLEEIDQEEKNKYPSS
jgi:hypothetical protein